MGLKIWLLSLLFMSSIAGAVDDCGEVLAQDKLIICLGDQYAEVDVKLTETYVNLTEKISSTGAEKLDVAQKAWLSFRDIDCEFQALAAEGGQAYQTFYISCLIEKTTIRTQELKSLYW